MGPDVGTPEYYYQIDQIKKVCCDLDTREDINKAIVMYLMDESFSRPAIAHAQKELIDELATFPR